MPVYAETPEAESDSPTPIVSGAEIVNNACKVKPDWLMAKNNNPYHLNIEQTNSSDIIIRADDTQVAANRFAEFSGNVLFVQGEQRIATSSASYNQESNQFRADGSLTYTDGYIAVRAEQIDADANGETATILDSEYYLIPRSAIGTAGRIDIQAAEESRLITLHDGTFTTCPGDNPAWQIRASEIEVNENESWGTARNAQFRLFDVPVLYIPRFTFPLNDERKSGFLYPTIRSSARNGVELEVPYYFNLAANYDLTFTPRYMSKRGLMTNTEFRFLNERHESELQVEFLANDDSLDTDNSRSFVRLEHRTNFNEAWTGYLDFSQVSDSAYINDFGNATVNRADPHLYRRGQIDYQAGDTLAQIQIEDFQMLGPYRAPYRTMPKVSVWHDEAMPGNFSLQFFSELSHFRNPNDSADNASRFHLEPTLSYAQVKTAWDWRADLSYLYTYYDQTADTQRDASVTRTLPQFRWHGRVHLERPFKQGGLQTLTPQIQYLYVPHQEQAQIGIYDTILMQDDYHSLFRPRRFTGLDRIANAHQITLGATTSFFDSNAVELMRLSLGQIIYLDESQTQLFDESSRITASNSELAAELDFQVGRRWYVSSALQYDTDLDLTRKGRVAVEYRKDDANLLQLNYRRVQGLVGTSEEVEQIGFSSTWKVANDWSIGGHWYNDLRTNRTMDALFGVQYDRCCWSIRISAYRRVNRNYDLSFADGPLPPADFDNGVSVQFILSGLSNSTGAIMDMLQQGIFGYRRPFYLSN
ncbi:LPS-assembly protein LptD [Aliidiomarina iranensis]|uniref:LPS-assembly protein LptD n=1 Tax=Aliidiomarina iranensis TaxID=1434071 RepID=UPI0018E55FBB|nr:LPS assembly protein LptD [Aliidiomarina iranensis]